MSYNLPVNQWIVIPDSFKITEQKCSHSIYKKFIFYNIRCIGDGISIITTEDKTENSLKLESLQTFYITNYNDNFFQCVTITSPILDNKKIRNFRDYETYLKLGQAKIFRLASYNLLQGNFEVFNGPNPINIMIP